jgi:hypothetical protein
LSRLRIAPIVEGHGEDSAIRILLERIWYELFRGQYLDVLKPIRSKRQKFVNEPREFGRVVDLAALKLQENRADDPEMILILLDADKDLPCVLGPDLLKKGRSHRGDVDLSCVIANVDYETWFVAAAPSLSEHLDLSEYEADLDPETARLGKGWIKQRIRRVKYSETVDQPSLTKAMDLALCREKSPSFDKLCRELEARLSRTA